MYMTVLVVNHEQPMTSIFHQNVKLPQTPILARGASIFGHSRRADQVKCQLHLSVTRPENKGGKPQPTRLIPCPQTDVTPGGTGLYRPTPLGPHRSTLYHTRAKCHREVGLETFSTKVMTFVVVGLLCCVVMTFVVVGLIAGRS